MTRKVRKYKIMKMWKKDMFKLLKARYPDATGEEIDLYLNKLIKDNIKIEDVKLHNNYTNKIFTSDTLDLTEFFYKRKPLSTEHGTLFNNDEYNPAVIMLKKFMSVRKVFKKKRQEVDKNSYEYFKYDLNQLLEKIKANSWYGVSGARSSMFFNLYCALAITGKGRTLIAVATMAFEMFMSNSVLFRTTDECLVYIKNVLNEERHFDDSFYLDHNIDIDKVYDKLYNTFGKYKRKCRKDIIYPILINLSKEDLNRLYYKNNLYEFCRNTHMKHLLRNFINKAEIFNNPNDIPDYLKDDVNEIWQLMKEYVFYNYPIIDRSIRLQTQMRRSVVVIDTDSNMIDMNPWYEFVMREVLTQEDIDKKEPTILRHIILYLLATNLSEMISDVLEKFLKYCNVPKERRNFLTMKNEYLFSRMLISEGKKNYASVIEFKEGKDMGGKLDIKGLMMNKSVCNRNASSIFKEILEHDILKSKEIDIPLILRKLNNFQKEIERSLIDGEMTYLSPASIKDFNSYKEPLSEQQVLATIFWNLSDPVEELVPPDNIYVIKLVSKTLDKLEIIKDKFPDKYELMKEKLFNNDNTKIASKGLYVIAIPKTLSKIPDWIVPLIDVPTITNDTLKPMMQVLLPLGLEEISSNSDLSTYSNILSF